MANTRDLRLRSDLEKLKLLMANTEGRIEVESTNGIPPDTYVIKFRLRSVEKIIGAKPIYRDMHRVQIQLPANYPISNPLALMLTPIFHPHVFSSNRICIGRKWLPSEFLDLFAVRIASIIKFDPNYFDFKSPANRDALEWVKRNMQLFPTDPYDFQLNPNTSGIAWKEIPPISWKER